MSHQKPIPITILTGFLGAGKTTLLNKILEENKDKKFGLIINEFGEVGIDGQLVSQNIGEEQMFEISNGCICCVVRGDLIKAVDQIITKNKIDYLIIETSGLAEPMPVAQTFEMEDLGGRVILDSIITLVDCENFDANLKDYEVSTEQIYAADLLILNKVEDVSADEVEKIKKKVLELNPYSYILENQGDLDTSLLIETGKWTYEDVVKGTRPPKTKETHEHAHECHDEHCTHEHHHHHEHEAVDEIVFSTPNEFSIEAFNEWLTKKIPKEVIRAKGFIRFKDHFLKSFLFQMVGARKSIMPFAPGTAPEENQNSRIVFIGKNLPKERILKELGEMVG